MFTCSDEHARLGRKVRVVGKRPYYTRPQLELGLNDAEGVFMPSIHIFLRILTIKPF